VYAADNDIPVGHLPPDVPRRPAIADPSGSEQRLNTFAAMASTSNTSPDFTYNSGASSLFNNGSGGDDSPNSLYKHPGDINKKAEPRQGIPAFSRSNVHPVGGNATTDIMFIRGKADDGVRNAVLNHRGDGFSPTGTTPNATYTEWTFR